MVLFIYFDATKKNCLFYDDQDIFPEQKNIPEMEKKTDWWNEIQTKNKFSIGCASINFNSRGQMESFFMTL
jgi:hypothetical protein